MARILLIAPAASDLPDVAATVQAIIRHHDCEVLQAADTSPREIVAAAQQGFEIVWLVGHLTGGGTFALQAEAELSAETIIAIVSISKASLVILTVCSSWRIAQRVLAETTAACIYTQADVYSADVMLVAGALASTLATTTSYRRAFEMARPGDIYIYQDSRNMPMQTEQPSPNTFNFLRLYETTESTQRDMRDLQIAVARLEGTVAGIKENLAAVVVDVQDLKKRSPNGRGGQPSLQAWLLIGGVILILVILLFRVSLS